MAVASSARAQETGARAPRSAAPLRVDGVAALVGGRAPGAGAHVVLRSDIDLLAWLEFAGDRSGVVELNDAMRAQVLDRLIGELVIEQEAERLGAEPPTVDEIAERRRAIAESVGGEQSLLELAREHAIDMSEIAEIARRRALILAFVRANGIERSSVSEGQVEAVFSGGSHPFRHLTWDEAREPLRVWLEQAAARRDIRRWVEVLRRRTSIQVIARYHDAE